MACNIHRAGNDSQFNTTAPTFKIIPENPRPWDDDLCVDIQEYSTDLDGDEVGYEVQWYRSQDGGLTFVYKKELSGLTPFCTCISSSFFASGDIWKAVVIPFEEASVDKDLQDKDSTRVEGEITWDQVVVSEDNVRPVVLITSPGAEDIIAVGDVTISWQSYDENDDPIFVDLFYATRKSKAILQPIENDLPGPGSLMWIPPGKASCDLSGNGSIDFQDLCLLANDWLSDSAGIEYYIFARGEDTNYAIGEVFSVGKVIVPQEMPSTPSGLIELLKQWRSK